MKQLLTILLYLLAAQAWSRTIPVGAGESIKSVRQAFALAANGDTVLLKKGIYKEGNLQLTKSVFFIGEEGAVLDGGHKNEILTISGESIVVKGIRFQNAGYSSMNDYASIKLVDASFVLVENNVIDHSYFAIHIANSTYSVVRNNTITGVAKNEQSSGNGIHLWKCENMLVKGNTIQGHRDGIYFEFVTHSIIEDNNSFNNIRYGLHFMFSNNNGYIGNTFTGNGAGVAVMYSHHVLMHSNHFEQNWGANAYGLLLKEINDSQIISNTFDTNTVGVLMETTNRIEVSDNSFHNNGWALRIQASCDDNLMQQNSFAGNTFDVATNGSLTLNRFVHNYWDKYDGYDMNRDGLGDVPYHPVSMYSMVIEQNPNAVILMRSFMVTLLDKAEKAIPSLTPENLVDEAPVMKMIRR